MGIKQDILDRPHHLLDAIDKHMQTPRQSLSHTIDPQTPDMPCSLLTNKIAETPTLNTYGILAVLNPTAHDPP